MEYLGHPSDRDYDQVLGTVSLGPFEEAGEMQFEWDVEPPSISRLPKKCDFLDNAGLVISLSIQGKEISRIGYIVNHSYDDPALLEEETQEVRFDRVVRNISKPLIQKKQNAMEMQEETQTVGVLQVMDGNTMTMMPMENQMALPKMEQTFFNSTGFPELPKQPSAGIGDVNNPFFN
jgi:hypothetical protein